MASKPDKFEIKFWLGLLNGFLNLEKNSDRPQNQFLSEYVVLKLAGPFLNKGRNIT